MRELGNIALAVKRANAGTQTAATHLQPQSSIGILNNSSHDRLWNGNIQGVSSDFIYVT
ncbi:MAG: hypothetical protein WDM86_23125 [Rhizomicrobium sp.]